MASVNRVIGDCEVQAVKCDPAFPIEVGDIIWQVPAGEALAGYARPASAMNEQGSKALTLDFLHNQFWGIALQRNGLQSGETVPLHSTLTHQPANVIKIAIRGQARMPLGSASAATTFLGGELIGGSIDTYSTSGAATAALQNQVVEQVTNVNQSIGRARPGTGELGNSSPAIEGQPATSENEVVFDFVSTIMYSGEPASTGVSTSSSSGAL